LPPPFQALHIPQAAQGYEAGRRPSEGVSEGSAKAAGKTGGLWQRIQDKLLAPKPGASGSRQKAMLVLVPLLFVVFIFVFFKWLYPAISPSQPVRKPQPVKVPKPVVAADTRIEWEIPAVYPKDLRDPAQLVSSEPIVTKQEPVPEPKPEPVKVEKMVVKGILYSASNPSAIIGSQIVHEGDKISGAAVVKINKNSVEFERNGEKWKQGLEP
jgi:type II secretory pathway component PulC